MIPNSNDLGKDVAGRFACVLQIPETTRTLTPFILAPPLLRTRNATHFHNQEEIYKKVLNNISLDIQNRDICKKLHLLNIEDADEAVKPNISHVRTKQSGTLKRAPRTTSFLPKCTFDHFFIDDQSYSSSSNKIDMTKVFCHSPKCDEQCQSFPSLSKLLLRPRLTLKKRRLSLHNQEDANKEGDMFLSQDKHKQEYRIPILNQSVLSGKEDDDEGYQLNIRKKPQWCKLPACVLLPSLDNDHIVDHWSKGKFPDNGISRRSFPILNLSLKARSESKRKYYHL